MAMICPRSRAGGGDRKPLPRRRLPRRPTTSDVAEANVNDFASGHRETVGSQNRQRAATTDGALAAKGCRLADRMRPICARGRLGFVRCNPIERVAPFAHGTAPRV